MRSSGFLLRSKNSILYLIEPVLAFIAVLLLVALFSPTFAPMKLRMIELHANDISSILQISKAGQIAEWMDGNEEIDPLLLSLSSELNPCYGYTFEVSEGEISKKTEYNRKSTGITVERLVIHKDRAFIARLTLWL